MFSLRCAVSILALSIRCTASAEVAGAAGSGMRGHSARKMMVLAGWEKTLIQVCFGKDASLLVPYVVAMSSRFSACGELFALSTAFSAAF